jgi:hypothetical protein
MLRRLGTVSRWRDLTVEFGRHESALNEIFYDTMNRLYDKYSHILEGVPEGFVRERAQAYADAIRNAGALLDSCAGFIDGTCVQVGRPSGKAQRATYSGHKRMNCIKFQAVTVVSHGSGQRKEPRRGRKEGLLGG